MFAETPQGPPRCIRFQSRPASLGAVAAGPPLASATTGCSPVTDIPNPNATGGTAEWIFASPQNSGLGNNCAGGRMPHELQRPALEGGNRLRDWPGNSGYPLSDSSGQGCGNFESGRTPGWAMAVDGNTNDGATLRWTNQGPYLFLSRPGCRATPIPLVPRFSTLTAMWNGC